MIVDDFVSRALLAGVGVAIAAGPLGAFVVWRRMAYFGETLAHSALLGVALGFLLQADVTLSIVVVCVLLAVVLVAMQRQQRLASDTLLGILSHGALSLGLVVLAFMEGLRLDLLGYLFGDILSVSRADILGIYLILLLVLAVLAFLWRPLLADTVHEELARVEGIPVVPARLGFMLLLALFIAVSMKVVGILLITSLLIIPAASVRCFSRTPEQMALYAGVAGCLAVSGGLLASLQWDLPAGPAVVLVAVAMFMFSQMLRVRM